MNYGVAAIVAICLLVLLIGVLKRKSQIIFFFFVRAAAGLAAIYFFNYFLKIQSIPVAVGVGPASFLTSGILGFSGVAMLYGMLFYKIL